MVIGVETILVVFVVNLACLFLERTHSVPGFRTVLHVWGWAGGCDRLVKVSLLIFTLLWTWYSDLRSWWICAVTLQANVGCPRLGLLIRDVLLLFLNFGTYRFLEKRPYPFSTGSVITFHF